MPEDLPLMIDTPKLLHCLHGWCLQYTATQGHRDIMRLLPEVLISDWSPTNAAWVCSSRLRPRPPGPRFNIKMSSYQYRKSHCGDKTVVRSSYLHNGISYTGKTASLYWFSPLGSISRQRHRRNTMGIPIIKIGRSHDRLIFTMEIPIPGKTSLTLRQGWEFGPVGLGHLLP